MIKRRRLLSAALASFLLAFGAVTFGVPSSAMAAGNQTLTFTVDCTPGPVAGVWVVDYTNNARSGWVNTISRSGSTATVTYTGTNSGDHWGVNVGCDYVGSYSTWKYSTSTSNANPDLWTSSTSAYIYCLVGTYASTGGTNVCFFG